MGKRWEFVLLLGLFFLALLLRFLYFPSNIYFGFDQARDAFTTLQLIGGNLKLVGPPTGVEGLFHGPLYYYLYAPFYFISQGDPTFATGFLRVMNALGVILIFLTGNTLFNKKVGLISALLFAFSFEQTQYAMYFNHPSLGVLSVALFYLGLALVFFKKQSMGLIIAALGLGLSLQFEFVLIYLFAISLFLLFIFRKQLIHVQRKTWLISFLILCLTLTSFVLAEVKFQFKIITHLSSIVSINGGGGGLPQVLNNIYILSTRLIHDNIISYSEIVNVSLAFFIITSLILMKNAVLRPKMIFLLIWVLGGILPYLNNKSDTPLYYYSLGAGVGLLILYSFIVFQVWQRWKIAAVILLAIPLISNTILIKENNYLGVIPTINVQSGMLLGDEKRIVDYIYKEALGQPFAISGVTMPLFVNTTWSYLFEWYGKNKYGYLPLWGGEGAAGYPGNLKIVSARSSLPPLRFFIIEPTRGIRSALIENMLREEGYFTKVIKEEKIGEFVVQKRESI